MDLSQHSVHTLPFSAVNILPGKHSDCPPSRLLKIDLGWQIIIIISIIIFI